jgi:hypothetical protein
MTDQPLQAAIGQNFLALRRHLPSLAGPCAFVLVLAMVVVPLPPFALDILFTFNISFALMILLASLYTTKPADFSAFPTLLLLTTLLRLSLNIAAARVILLEGYQGSDAAGRVIEAFGAFAVGGNYAVGIAVFAILVIINFVVITKGAGRIAEVAARFVLDGMPGKQMAIDADLNAGLINQEEATRRRREVSHESDFFGAMDGASKFVRGDAVAAVLILFINLAGGFVIAIWQHGLSLAEAGQTYTLLTIGDGLVAQIPALVISSAAAVIVSRVTTGHDVGNQVISQLAAYPKAWWLASGIVGLFGIRAVRRGARRHRLRNRPRTPKSTSASSRSSSLWKFKWVTAWSGSSTRNETADCCAACERCVAKCRGSSGFWFRSCMCATTRICNPADIVSWFTASSGQLAKSTQTSFWQCHRATSRKTSPPSQPAIRCLAALPNGSCTAWPSRRARRDIPFLTPRLSSRPISSG